jgi:tRNA isopentenyl-2-thiomethyl-A-37 hydroxylase MiaE
MVYIKKSKGLTLGRERKDHYVNELFKFMKKDGRKDALCDRLLFSAMKRSCERFKVLSENIKDPELAKFYRDLMISEAGHYTTFLGFAKKYTDNIDVDKRWKEWIEFETPNSEVRKNRICSRINEKIIVILEFAFQPTFSTISLNYKSITFKITRN